MQHQIAIVSLLAAIAGAICLAVFLGVKGVRLYKRTGAAARPKVQLSVLGHPGAKVAHNTGLPEFITISGIKFRSVMQSTMEHDMWMMAKLRKAGLDELAVKPDETVNDYAVRLLHEVIASGEAMLLLGGLLIPNTQGDLEWTPQLAEKSAEILRAVSDPVEKSVIHSAIISMLSGFFVLGIGSYDRTNGASLAPSKAQPSVQPIPVPSA